MICPGAISVHLVGDAGVFGDFVSVRAVAIITDDMSEYVCVFEEEGTQRHSDRYYLRLSPNTTIALKGRLPFAAVGIPPIWFDAGVVGVEVAIDVPTRAEEGDVVEDVGATANFSTTFASPSASSASVGLE